MDVIRIHGLELDCIVGLRPTERMRAQRLRLDLAMGVDTRAAGQSGRIASTIDYDRAAEDILALLRFRRYQLIEVAAEELAAMLLGCYEHCTWVRLRLEKPGALAGRAQAASIEVNRSASDLLEPARGELPGLRLLVRTRDATLSVERLEAGGVLAPATEARCLLRVISGQLHCSDGRLWFAGLARPEGNEGDEFRAGGEGARVFRCAVGRDSA